MGHEAGPHPPSLWVAGHLQLGHLQNQEAQCFTGCPFSCARVLMDPLVLLSHGSPTPRTMLCIISLFLTSVESSWEWFLPSLGELDAIALRVRVSKWRVTWNKTLSWLKKNWWGGYWECQLCLPLLLKPIFQRVATLKSNLESTRCLSGSRCCQVFRLGGNRDHCNS